MSPNIWWHHKRKIFCSFFFLIHIPPPASASLVSLSYSRSCYFLRRFFCCCWCVLVSVLHYAFRIFLRFFIFFSFFGILWADLFVLCWFLKMILLFFQPNVMHNTEWWDFILFRHNNLTGDKVNFGFYLYIWLFVYKSIISARKKKKLFNVLSAKLSFH